MIQEQIMIFIKKKMLTKFLFYFWNELSYLNINSPLNQFELISSPSSYFNFDIISNIIYIVFGDLALINILQIFIFSIISFAFSMFISDKFKFSNNILIKILQRFVFINSILALICLIFYLFDISLFLLDTIFDNAMERGKDLVVAGSKDIAPNLGIGAAAGKATAEAFKHTSGMPTVPRIAVVGSTVLATAAGTKVGLELGKHAMDNTKKDNKIEVSKLDEIDTDRSHLPSDFDGGFINNPLENNEIPLIIMVNGLSYLNYIEFSFILTLFSLLLRKYLNIKIQSFILKLKNKYINKNKKVENINDENITLNKAFNTVDKYNNYLIVFIFICLIWIMFINIYFSINLAENIDSYVKVYNHLKGK